MADAPQLAKDISEISSARRRIEDMILREISKLQPRGDGEKALTWSPWHGFRV